MPILSKPSGAVPTALVYITVGALMDVWTLVWWWFFPPETQTGWFWLIGILATGTTLLIIGLTLGRIGRAARHDELPPPEVTEPVAQAEQNAAANAPLIAPGNPVQPAVAPGGQPVAVATPMAANQPVYPRTKG